MGRLYTNEKYRISIIISILIILGFTAVVGVNYNTYSTIIKDDIRNITKLSSSNIYSEINNELIKPIFVSLTMANDRFLIQWLENESGEDVEILKDYLQGLEIKYDYSSVFLISEKSNQYYHFNGVHKTISEENAHDQWYYDFVDSGKTYDLDVDIDEITNAMTVFVNCRVTNDDNQLIGVVGVGLEMSEVQKILGVFEDAYSLEAFLVDEAGLVQVHTSNQLIEKYSVMDDETIEGLMPTIVANQSSLETFRYNENGLDGYIITRYIEDLEWYLMVKKDTSILKSTFDAQLAEEIMILLLVLAGVVVASHQLIKNHEKRLLVTAKTDALTGLLNRRGFDYQMFDALKEAMMNHKAFSVFIFDIDDFKVINDTYGHLFGDRVIEEVARYVSQDLSEGSLLARWGGDEFAGFIHGTSEEAQVELEAIIKGIASNENFQAHNITVSIGMTTSRSIDTPDTVIARADKALYRAKNQGKNQLLVNN